jgi:hypothetical protein
MRGVLGTPPISLKTETSHNQRSWDGSRGRLAWKGRAIQRRAHQEFGRRDGLVVCELMYNNTVTKIVRLGNELPHAHRAQKLRGWAEVPLHMGTAYRYPGRVNARELKFYAAPPRTSQDCLRVHSGDLAGLSPLQPLPLPHEQATASHTKYGRLHSHLRPAYVHLSWDVAFRNARGRRRCVCTCCGCISAPLQLAAIAELNGGSTSNVRCSSSGAWDLAGAAGGCKQRR